MLRNFTKEISGTDDKPGRDWLARWRQLFQNDIIFTYTSGIDRSRFSTDSIYKYKLYFKLMEKKLQQYKVNPNMT